MKKTTDVFFRAYNSKSHLTLNNEDRTFAYIESKDSFESLEKVCSYNEVPQLVRFALYTYLLDGEEITDFDNWRERYIILCQSLWYRKPKETREMTLGKFWRKFADRLLFCIEDVEVDISKFYAYSDNGRVLFNDGSYYYNDCPFNVNLLNSFRTYNDCIDGSFEKEVQHMQRTDDGSIITWYETTQIPVLRKDFMEEGIGYENHDIYISSNGEFRTYGLSYGETYELSYYERKGNFIEVKNTVLKPKPLTSLGHFAAYS